MSVPAFEELVEADQVAAVVEAHRYRYRDEHQLQESIAAALAARGFPVEREVALAGGGRIDLLVGAVGVEVKTNGQAGAVHRQLVRYARSPDVASLVLVTTRVRHTQLPSVVEGKRVLTVLVLSGF